MVKEDIEYVAKSFRSARNINEIKPNCLSCKCLKHCISCVFDDNTKVRCLFYGMLKTNIEDCADKINAVGVLTPDEIKELIRIVQTKEMK